MPPDLITFSKDAAELLSDLQSRNERMFLLTFLIVNTAPTRERLENDIFTVNGIAQKYNCAVKRLDWQQEQGYMSSLALGYNGIEIQRGMTTSSTAIFVPFMTRELRMDGPSLYYGMNALSHNVIMADRKKLKSANGLYLGSTGSGKSFAAKRELLNVFLAIPQDRIIVVDPMGEYAPLVERLGGQVIEIAPDSPNHISPMDVQMDMGSGDSPLSLKADFLLSLCELVVGGRDGLQPIEKTVIDRCVRQVYREMALGLETAKTPLLQDLYEELLRQPEPEAKRIATALELYCTGSLNLFNHPTNVNLNSRVVCFVLKGIGSNHAYARSISERIQNGESPDAICGSLRKEKAWTVSTSTLYRYIDRGYIPNVTIADLPCPRCKRRYRKVRKAKRAPVGVSIEFRPYEVSARASFGHWEMDCVIGKAKGKRQALLVLTERLTRYEMIFKLSQKTAANVNRIVESTLSKYPQGTFRSITVDNGSEFASAYQLPLPVYYCHPFCSSERGSNENANKIIRRYFKKGRSLYHVTQAQCDAVAERMNAMHRKILDYHTAQELFDAHVNSLL